MRPPEWDALRALLGSPLDAPALQEIRREAPVEAFPDGAATVSLKPHGLSLVFEPTAFPPYLKVFVAFHLRTIHYEGFDGYPNGLPCGVAFGDSKETVAAQCGVPLQAGGGYESKEFERYIPRWVRFNHEEVQLHFQFAPAGGVELVTVSLLAG